MKSKEIKKEKKDKVKSKDEIKKDKSKVKSKDETKKRDNKVKSGDNKKAKKDGFFKEVIDELKKVKWPDKKYMVKYSAATFVTIIMCSLYFYLITVLFALIKGIR